MTLVLQTRTKNKEDGRTQVNIFEILFRRPLGLAILRKANFPKLGLKCQRQIIASVENAKRTEFSQSAIPERGCQHLAE